MHENNKAVRKGSARNIKSYAFPCGLPVSLPVLPMPTIVSESQMPPPGKAATPSIDCNDFSPLPSLRTIHEHGNRLAIDCGRIFCPNKFFHSESQNEDGSPEIPLKRLPKRGLLNVTSCWKYLDPRLMTMRR